MLKRLLTFSSLLATAATLNAQLAVENILTPAQLVQDVLLGSGVTVSNITYNGGPADVVNEQAGVFTGAINSIGIDAGVILSSGAVDVALGPNVGTGTTLGGGNFGFGDPDLSALSGVDMNDASILEFDFVPVGDSIVFSFVFASEEYPEYVCGTVNDAFGFFLSGPGLSGPFTNNAVNLALIPGGQIPVSINTVNPGVSGANGVASNCSALDPNWTANSVYYQSNAGSLEVEFDGQTVVLTARSPVICGETYHIKMAIADGGDTAFDSAVFLEAGSFQSTPFIPTLSPGPSIVGLNTILESCYEITFDFIQIGQSSDTSVVQISTGGTATQGVDIVPALPDSLIFLPGQNSQAVSFTVPVDFDGLETLIITLTSESQCSGTFITNEFLFYIDSSPPPLITGGFTQVPCQGSATLTPTVSGGFPPYSIGWSTGQTGPSITVAPTSGTAYNVTLTDDCGSTAVGQFFVDLEPPPPVSLTLQGPSTLMEACDMATLEVGRPVGIPGGVTMDLFFQGTATNGSDFVLPGSVLIGDGVPSVSLDFNPLEDGVADDGETVTITASYADACGSTSEASVTVTIIDAPPISLETDDFTVECQPDSILLEAVGVGGVGTLSYVWSNGDQGPFSYVTMQVPGTYTVTATDQCGRSESAVSIIQTICDLVIPNVITPNGDGNNDYFEIEGILYVSNTVRVFNRWGQTVYDASNYRNQWKADDVPDGTYFYEVVVSRNDTKYTGSLTILRD